MLLTTFAEGNLVNMSVHEKTYSFVPQKSSNVRPTLTLLPRSEMINLDVQPCVPFIIIL